MHPFNDLQVASGSVAIAWFGQSSFAIKAASGDVIFVDPYFPRVRPPERFIHAEPPIDEADLRVDFVVLTHDHRDHTWPESLSRIAAAWPEVVFYGPEESIQRLEAEGIRGAGLETVSAGESRSLGSFTLHAVYAKPPEGDPEKGIAAPDVTHLGYVIDAGGVSVYISGDPINTFAERDDLIDPIRRLAPDIGLLTTHPTEGEFPFFEGSVAMALRIGLKAAVPAHYNCFVKRNYDPVDWSAAFPEDGPRRLIIPYGGWVEYTPPSK